MSIDNYASWLNHKWMLEHIKLISVLKPTDKTDPDYEGKLKIYQNALAIPKKLSNSIKIQNEEISRRIRNKK